MSVVTTQSLFQYLIASLGQAFSPNCPIQNTSDFNLIYTDPTTFADTVLTLNVDFTVTGAFTAGVCSAPTVTLEASGLHYAIGGKLTIQRLTPETQPTVYVDGVKYLAAVPNNSLDWLCYSIQALYDIVNRCLRVPASSAVQSPIPLALRKGMLAGWDASGNFTVYAASGTVVQPFPPALAPSFVTFLAAITATTGGVAGCLDFVDVTAITQPIMVDVSIADITQRWKLRPAQGGDPAVSDGIGCVVPVTNPNAMRWIRG